MKRIYMTVIFCFFTGICFSDSDYRITIDPMYLIDGSQILAGESIEHVVDLDIKKPIGFSSLQVEISGSGTARIYHESSNDGYDYNTVSGYSDIVTSLTAGSEIYQFGLPFARFLKIIFAETGGVNPIIVESATLAIQ